MARISTRAFVELQTANFQALAVQPFPALHSCSRHQSTAVSHRQLQTDMYRANAQLGGADSTWPRPTGLRSRTACRMLASAAAAAGSPDRARDSIVRTKCPAPITQYINNQLLPDARGLKAAWLGLYTGPLTPAASFRPPPWRPPNAQVGLPACAWLTDSSSIDFRSAQATLLSCLLSPTFCVYLQCTCYI